MAISLDDAFRLAAELLDPTITANPPRQVLLKVSKALIELRRWDPYAGGRGAYLIKLHHEGALDFVYDPSGPEPVFRLPFTLVLSRRAPARPPRGTSLSLERTYWLEPDQDWADSNRDVMQLSAQLLPVFLRGTGRFVAGTDQEPPTARRPEVMLEAAFMPEAVVPGPA